MEFKQHSHIKKTSRVTSASKVHRSNAIAVRIKHGKQNPTRESSLASMKTLRRKTQCGPHGYMFEVSKLNYELTTKNAYEKNNKEESTYERTRRSRKMQQKRSRKLYL